MRQRAMDILGLNYAQTASGQRSLEIEVETYLNDNGVGIDSLTFWQVSTLFFPKFITILTDNTKGKSTTVSNYFCTRYGYHSHPSICCSM
jgi:hypothetical protein